MTARLMPMAAGWYSPPSRLVAAHELSQNGQNWTARIEIVLPHLDHGNKNDSRIP
jgi:hypothetical protein